MPSGVLSSHPRVRNLSSARRLSPDWGRRPYYGGVLAHRAACGEQDPESRPTVSPALLAIAFHRSDPDLAANFGGKLEGLCVRTLWAPSPPPWTNKPKTEAGTSAPRGRQLTACSSAPGNLLGSVDPPEKFERKPTLAPRSAKVRRCVGADR